MKKAYVLINTQPGEAEMVAEALRLRPEVIAADVVSGPHDVIALVQGKDANAVARMTLSDIPAVDGIRDTAACLVSSKSKFNRTRES